jgi:hypothetical protein
MENKEKLKLNKFFLSFIFILLLGAYFVSGIYGLKVVFILLFFTIPFYLILDLFDLNLTEKILSALFISLAFFSLIIYWINQIIFSYRYSIVISYIILIILYFIIKFLKKGGKNQHIPHPPNI